MHYTPVKHGVTPSRKTSIDFEKFHLSLCKPILGVPKYANNAMTLSQLGRTPFSMNIETQMFKYFQRYPKLIKESFLQLAFQDIIAQTIKEKNRG